MSLDFRVRCVDPTKTLTEHRIYTPITLAKDQGAFRKRGVSWDDATHIILMNDDKRTITAYKNRFERVNGQ